MISSPGCECLGANGSRLELDDHLEDLASGDAQVVPLKIDALGSDLLACATCSAKPVVATSAAIAMIRFVFI